MASLIALAAIGLFAGGVIAGIVGVVSVAIRREEKNLTLTTEATDQVTRAGRWVNGVHVRAPRGAVVGGPGAVNATSFSGRSAGTALALQVPSPRHPCTQLTGYDPDAQ